MPWKETCRMTEREAFIVACRRGELGVAEVCRAFEISRKTWYKWLARHHAEGLTGLADRSRARRTQEHEVSGRVVMLTFHSGEDRRVKKAFQAGYRAGVYSAVANEVIRATMEETRANRRASSAKLRWAVRGPR